ncbi:hypothetical protein NDU88_000332 [Pleurodeles waltl]|uniref:Uncharacterized protein n=1 Tax=Pleurodeles waltl TaxID=8319 RepID=A0AAV7LCR0_PLEWA|nr:hypothetical protein NDU88_000332 [Pleurodeles waltl]
MAIVGTPFAFAWPEAERSPAPSYACGAAPGASLLAALSRGMAPVIRGGESFPLLSLSPRPLLLSSTGWRPRSGVGVAAEPAPSLRVGHLAHTRPDSQRPCGHPTRPIQLAACGGTKWLCRSAAVVIRQLANSKWASTTSGEEDELCPYSLDPGRPS